MLPLLAFSVTIGNLILLIDYFLPPSQEFLDTVVLFSRGKTEDKLRIIFDMCDNDRNGVIDKGELVEMIRSLVEMARTTSLTDLQVTELIDGMFQVSS